MLAVPPAHSEAKPGQTKPNATFLESVGLDVVHERVRCLTEWLLDALVGRRQTSGRPVVNIYGPLTSDGISPRTGCCCNPGAGEVPLGLFTDALDRCFADSGDRMTKNEFGRCLEGSTSPGAVRVSLGLASTFADVHALAALPGEFVR